jgi:hypothetical protein
MTWVPWTHSRLSASSGYGAGIASPGWYHHLFSHDEHVVEHWFTRVAGVLRERDLPVSSAHAIEATRLATALATLRGRPAAGLEEVQEATLSVMCDGRAALLSYVTTALVVGEDMGVVPDGAPLVPLDADLRRTARTLRLAFSPTPKEVVLDLRKDKDRAKSHLLHRLAVLDIGWGTPQYVSGRGTFKEAWSLAWQPEFAVAVVIAAHWGTTVPAAATARLTADIGPLADVTDRIEQALLADLDPALPTLLTVLDERAAHEADVVQLLDALPALVRAQRYGTVRRTDTASLAEVADALLARAAAGLPVAVGGLNPDAAAELRRHIDAVTGVIGLLPSTAHGLWFGTLRRILGRGDVPGILAGRLTRTLLDAGELTIDDARDGLSRALSGGHTVGDRAAFAEGFLSASALLLIHDPTIVGIVDEWIAGLRPDEFTEVLPVLRRAFGAFTKPEREAIAQRAAVRTAPTGPAEHDPPYDAMSDALATVRLLLQPVERQAAGGHGVRSADD